MATQGAIRLITDESLTRLKKTADALSAWADIEPLQFTNFAGLSFDRDFLAAQRLKDIADWAEKLQAHVIASSPVQDTPQEK
jgi:hypothetical protein